MEPTKRTVNQKAGRSLNKGRRPMVALAVVLGASSLLGVLPPTSHLGAAEPTPQEQALGVLARQLGVSPKTLAVAGETQSTFPFVDRRATEFKVVDRKGNVYGIALDRGEIVDANKLASDDREARRSRFGNLDQRLVEELDQAKPDQPIAVIIWFSQGEQRLSPRPDAEKQLSDADVDRVYAEVDARRADQVAKAAGPVLRLLANMGVDAGKADPLTPALAVQLTPRQLADLRKADSIDTIYLDEQSTETLDVSVPTIGANTVHGAGITGKGVKTAVIEVGGRVAASNPFLPVEVHDNVNVCPRCQAIQQGFRGSSPPTPASRCSLRRSIRAQA